MSELRSEKYVNNLPGTLQANTIYYVKNGSGVDVYLTNSTGTIVAYPLNKGTSGINETAYTDTITWTGTTPPGGTTNNTHQWTRVGSLVTGRITLSYANNAAGITAVTLNIPSGWPTPLIPAGLSGTNVELFPVLANTMTNGLAAQSLTAKLAYNGTVYQITSTTGATNKYYYFTVNYWTTDS